MSQTERTIAQIQAILGNNVAGEISPEDVRDAMATALGGYASLILSIVGAPIVKSAVAQAPLVVTEYDNKLAQSADENISGTSADVGTGVITIGQTGIYSYHFNASFSISAPNKNITFQLFVNSIVGSVEASRFNATSGQNGAAGFSVILLCNAGDLIDVRTFIDSGSANITFSSIGFNCHRVG